MERCVVRAFGRAARALVEDAGEGPWSVVVNPSVEQALLDFASVVVFVADDAAAPEVQSAINDTTAFGRASVLVALGGEAWANVVVRIAEGPPSVCLRALLFWAQRCQQVTALERVKLVARRFDPADSTHRLRHVLDPHIADFTVLLIDDPVESTAAIVPVFRARVESCAARLPRTEAYSLRLRQELDWWLADETRMTAILALADIATNLREQGYRTTPNIITRCGGSLVAHALGITAFDPVAHALDFDYWKTSYFVLGVSLEAFTANPELHCTLGGVPWGISYAIHLDGLERGSWTIWEPGDDRRLTALRHLEGRELETESDMIPRPQRALERLAAIIELLGRPATDEVRRAWRLARGVPTDRERMLSVPSSDARTAGMLLYCDQVAEALAGWLDISRKDAWRLVRSHQDEGSWRSYLAMLAEDTEARGWPRSVDDFERHLGARCVASRTRAEALEEALIVLTRLRRGDRLHPVLDRTLVDIGLGGSPLADRDRPLPVVLDETTAHLAPLLADAGLHPIVAVRRDGVLDSAIVACRLLATSDAETYVCRSLEHRIGVIEIATPVAPEAAERIIDAIDALALRDRVGAAFRVTVPGGEPPRLYRR